MNRGNRPNFQPTTWLPKPPSPPALDAGGSGGELGDALSAEASTSVVAGSTAAGAVAAALAVAGVVLLVRGKQRAKKQQFIGSFMATPHSPTRRARISGTGTGGDAGPSLAPVAPRVV